MPIDFKRLGPDAANHKLQQVLNRLPHEKVRCTDVETSGLDWRKNHIVGYVFTFGPKPVDSYYLPFRHAGGGNIGGRSGPQSATGWDGEVYPEEVELIRLLDQQGTMTFGHNMAFDLRFMFRTGFRKFRARIEDTIINAPLLNEWQGSFSLESCAQLARVAAKKSSEMYAHIRRLFPEAPEGPKSMGWYWRLAGDDEMAVEYAEGDGTTTWQLRDWQIPRIAEQELSTVHDIESRLIPVLARAMTRGVRVDEERLGLLLEHIDTEITKLNEGFGKIDFGVWVKDDIRAWMERHGHTDWPLTPGRVDKAGTLHRQPSFTKDWLEKYPAGQAVIKARELTQLRDSFIIPIKDNHLWRGRVHTTFNQLRSDDFGTITGRLSSSEPNMQQVHKRNKELGRLFRSLFIPDEGLIWGSRDYKQCEPVLLAYYSRAKVLLDGYRADPPIDAHSSVAQAANLDRETGKRVNQTLITGGGKGVLTTKYKIPVDKVDEVWDNYFNAMPEIRDFQRKATRRMQHRGFVLSLLLRRARLRDPNKAYVALNRLLQCGNADILKSKMVEIDDYLESEGRPPVETLLNVHDALESQFAEEARKHYDECLRIMTNFGPGQLIELDVPLGVDSGEGPDWAVATYGEDKSKPEPTPKKAMKRKGGKK